MTPLRSGHAGLALMEVKPGLFGYSSPLTALLRMQVRLVGRREMRLLRIPGERRGVVRLGAGARFDRTRIRAVLGPRL